MTPQDLADVYAKAFTNERHWSATECATLLSHPNTHISGDQRSFAMLRVTEEEAEILTLATDPIHQRQGLARAALMDAHALAKTSGAHEIFLEVADDNVAAKALYRSMGYAIVGQRKGYYPRTNTAAVDAIVMRCDLNAA